MCACTKKSRGPVADSDKTEMPTPKRLRDARRKGQVSKSTELNAVAVMATVLGLCALGAWQVAVVLQQLVKQAITTAFAPDSEAAWASYRAALMSTSLYIVVALFAAVTVAAALAARVQAGSIFSLDPVMPKLERVNPMAGLKRIFSKRTLLTFALNLVKTVLLFGVIYLAGRARIDDVLAMMHLPSAQIALAGAKLLMTLMSFALAVYLVMAALDVVGQRHWFIDGLKMAKHEVKRDHREDQGDPLVKGHRRALAMELVFAEVERSVKTASVVIVNPTHLAIALTYKPGETDLPMVVAKGKDDVAAIIRRVAEQHGVPVVRDVALARALYEKTPVDEFIGRELFEPVARLLLWVRQLEAQSGREGP